MTITPNSSLYQLSTHKTIEDNECLIAQVYLFKIHLTLDTAVISRKNC